MQMLWEGWLEAAQQLAMESPHQSSMEIAWKLLGIIINAPWNSLWSCYENAINAAWKSFRIWPPAARNHHRIACSLASIFHAIARIRSCNFYASPMRFPSMLMHLPSIPHARPCTSLGISHWDSNIYAWG